MILEFMSLDRISCMRPHNTIEISASSSSSWSSTTSLNIQVLLSDDFGLWDARWKLDVIASIGAIVPDVVLNHYHSGCGVGEAQTRCEVVGFVCVGPDVAKVTKKSDTAKVWLPPCKGATRENWLPKFAEITSVPCADSLHAPPNRLQLSVRRVWWMKFSWDCDHGPALGNGNPVKDYEILVKSGCFSATLWLCNEFRISSH